MTTLHIFDVTEDKTGAWITEPTDSGEVAPEDEWHAKQDTGTHHFDTHIAWQCGDEITLEAPDRFDDRDWREITVAIRSRFAEVDG